MHEVILGKTLQKQNFRKQLLGRGILEATGQISRGGAHRPAQLYVVKPADLYSTIGENPRSQLAVSERSGY